VIQQLKLAPIPAEALVEQAQHFCYLIEHIGEFLNRVWLGEVSQVLSRIHATIGGMERGSCDTSFEECSDIEERFDLFCQLKRAVGENDVYEVNADRNGVLYGSLADDFTDLYFELKRGLELLEGKAELSEALAIWREGYWWHWGQHLLDAERHLYHLRIHNRIQ